MNISTWLFKDTKISCKRHDEHYYEIKIDTGNIKAEIIMQDEFLIKFLEICNNAKEERFAEIKNENRKLNRKLLDAECLIDRYEEHMQVLREKRELD